LESCFWIIGRSDVGSGHRLKALKIRFDLILQLILNADLGSKGNPKQRMSHSRWPIRPSRSWKKSTSSTWTRRLSQVRLHRLTWRLWRLQSIWLMRRLWLTWRLHLQSKAAMTIYNKRGCKRGCTHDDCWSFLMHQFGAWSTTGLRTISKGLEGNQSCQWHDQYERVPWWWKMSEQWYHSHIVFHIWRVSGAYVWRVSGAWRGSSSIPVLWKCPTTW
jgi:hypothetical protein